jgi:hypothetical protein
MGHRALLNSSPNAKFPATEEQLRVMSELPGRAFQADGFVPIFWLAMFGTDDVRDTPSPHLVCSKRNALNTLDRRRSGIERLVGPRFAQLLVQFVDLIQAEMGPYLIVRLDELAGASDNIDDFDDALRAALLAMGSLTMATQKPTPAVQAVFASFCGMAKGWQKKDHATTIVSGEATGWPETPEESAWRQAIAGHPTEDFLPFDVTAQLGAGDLVRHPKFGDGVVTEVRGPEKAEILFQAGSKTLACNKAG